MRFYLPSKSKNMKKKKHKCHGKTEVKPNCNVGMNRIHKYKRRKICHSRYGTYGGKHIQCQYVKKGWRYSCDFWKPGRPHTKKLCKHKRL